MISTPYLFLNESRGNSKMASVQTKTPEPAKYKGPFKLFSSKFAAIWGLKMEKSLPQKLAIPLAVPLIDVGNAS